MIGKRAVITGLAAVICVALGTATPAVAKTGTTRIVDDDYPSSGACKGAGYATIQDAVDTFSPGESGAITVCAGTYSETITMSGLGKIKLLGKKGATIVVPGATSPITVTNTARLTMTGFTVDGAGNFIIAGGMLTTVNTNLIITKNTFQNALDNHAIDAINNTGSALTVKVLKNTYVTTGSGLFAQNDGGPIVVTATGNSLTNVRAGFVIISATGNGSATITGNRLQGDGTDTGIVLVGIRKPKIFRNTVDDFIDGINLIDVSSGKVFGNKVRCAQFGVAIHTSMFGSSSNKVLRNTFEGLAHGFTGVFILTGGVGKSADFNQIRDNKISDPAGSYDTTFGVKLNALDAPINGTQIAGNKLINVDTPFAHSGDTNTKIKSNTCTPASPCFP